MARATLAGHEVVVELLKAGGAVEGDSNDPGKP